jgi:hypothetical protein
MLCSRPLEGQAEKDGDAIRYACRACGRVALHTSFDPTRYVPVLHLLSGWTRERTEAGEKALTILTDDAPAVTDGIAVEGILSLPTIPAKIEQNVIKLLKAIRRRSKYFGHEVALRSATDYTLAYLEHFAEGSEFRPPILKLLQQVIELGWLKHYTTPDSCTRYELTVKGLQEIERFDKVIPDSVNVFVAMKFGDDLLDQAYREAMAPAIRDCGYVPLQMAYLEHNNNIMDEMLGSIRRSRFLLADLTHQNQNVYFEAGFAQGLGIPVIYTCHESSIKDIMFDTQGIGRQLRESWPVRCQIHSMPVELRHGKGYIHQLRPGRPDAGR